MGRYTVVYHFEHYDDITEEYNFWTELLDSIDFVATYGYDFGNGLRVMVKSINIIL